jgi:O-Antigen ligase
VTAQILPERQLMIFGISTDHYRAVLVWLMFASSFFVIIEPAPTDVFFLLAFACSLAGGLHISPALAPLIVLLALFNVGGFTSLLQVLDDGTARKFVVTSLYMAASAVFIAAYISRDTINRIDRINRAWIIGASIASVFGLLGVFNIAGLASKFTLYDRAVSTFKDPNVFSTFIIYPTIILAQNTLLGQARRPFLNIALLLLNLAALFLAFSRGAWLNFLIASVLLAGLTFMLTPSALLRSRIIGILIAGLVAAGALLAILLSIESVREIFLIRFSLNQSYDLGETGRFGNQLNAIPMLIERPLGFGPLQFRHYFSEDPHNVFVNAFASYGWLGGLSYVTLVVCTLVVGIKAVLCRSPLQGAAIAAFACFFAVVVQGGQIDIDHWRHFYWLAGLSWGIFAVIFARHLQTESMSLVGATGFEPATPIPPE